MKEVQQFESLIAEYYGAKYGVATDCCTHAIELCLRHTKATQATSPKHTYLSVPMTFEKLNLNWSFCNENWCNYYYVSDRIIDAAVYWKEKGYIPNTFMCLSFQYKKHLNLIRGGMILCDNEHDYVMLKRMSYDGRAPNIPWAEQDITTYGYHYYMTPETALMGIEKFKEVKDIKPKEWSYLNYPDLSELTIFRNR
jgi:dTDP-4-amino-4,6-dideoxygalactose transaminase